MSSFVYANGGITPLLNGTNFFGWQQAVLDAAYAGGFINVLLGKSLKPDDPLDLNPDVVKRETPLPDLAETQRAAARVEDIQLTTGDDINEGVGLMTDQKGKTVSVDQRRREYLLWERQNFSAKSLLLKSVDDSFHWEVVDTELASEAWKSICDAHQFNQSAVIASIRSDLRKFVLLDQGDMQAHLRIFGGLVERGIKSQMTEFNSDHARCEVFIESLPWSLKDIRREFYALPLSQQTFPKLRASYLEEMRERKASKERQDEVINGNVFSTVRGARGGYRGGRDGSRGGVARRPDTPRYPGKTTTQKDIYIQNSKPPQGKCFKCGEYGHWKKDCRKKETTLTAQEHQDYSMATMSGIRIKDQSDTTIVTWIVDTGATQHMTGNALLLSDVETFSNPKTFNTIDFTSTATAVGNVSCISPSGKFFEIHGVYYVPNANMNILSAKRLFKRGWTPIFTENGGEIINNGEMYTMMEAEELWTVDIRRPAVQSNKALLSKAHGGKTLEEWHRVLGHLAISSILKLEESGTVEDLLIKGDRSRFTTDQCESCMVSKSTRLTFGHIPMRATKPLELLHSDIAGPFIMTPDGFQYYGTLVDDYTGIVSIFPLRTKDEVKEKVMDNVRLLERQLDHKVKVIRTDGGREYLGPTWTHFLRYSGIIHQITTPYTPQLNGVAERMNRTIKEMAGAILRESGLGPEKWREAALYVMGLLNRTRVVSDKKTAYEWLFKRKPRLSTIHPFGCEAWIHIPEERRAKSDLTLPKAWKGRLIGLPNETSGWRFLHPTTGIVANSRDARFPRDGAMNFQRSDDEATIEQSGMEPAVPENEPVDNVSAEPVDDDLPSDNHSPLVETDTEVQRTTPVTTEPEMQVSVDSQPKRYDLRQRRPQVLLQSTPAIIGGDDRFPAWILSVQGGLTDPDPWTYEEAMTSARREEWKDAMQKEFSNMSKASTWEDAVLPGDRKLVGCKWVYKTKRDEHGRITSHKGRIVAKGYSQIPGQDFDSTSSPVARTTSLRIILTIAAKQNLCLGQMDFVAAFLNGVLDRPIYMECPPGYTLAKGFNCVKLNKALYGLKQSGRTKLGTSPRRSSYRRGLGTYRLF